jgi:hypothetical protein
VTPAYTPLSKGEAPAYTPLSKDEVPAYTPLSKGDAPAYTPLSKDKAPAYSPLSKEPEQTSLFETPVASPASVGKFDFSWESEAFHQQDYRRGADDIDFKWNVDVGRLDLSPAAAITAAADEQANAAAARKREDESNGVFDDDTFHLRSSETEYAEFLTSKKNAEFQELLDEEFEKIRERQAEIDEERNRINESMMTPPEPTPSVLVKGEDARSAADERIREYLRRADLEMQRALSSQSAFGPESAKGPEPTSAPFRFEPLDAPEAKEPESFDPYESYGGDAFSVPDEQDTNVRAFGFKHGEGDIAWEYEHKDYDPAVSAISDDGDAERTPSYLEGRPSGAGTDGAVPAVTAALGEELFMTDFANPFAPAAVDVGSAETPAAEPVEAPVEAPATGFIFKEEASVPEESREEAAGPEDAQQETPSDEPSDSGIFITDFANPFADEAAASLSLAPVAAEAAPAPVTVEATPELAAVEATPELATAEAAPAPAAAEATPELATAEATPTPVIPEAMPELVAVEAMPELVTAEVAPELVTAEAAPASVAAETTPAPDVSTSGGSFTFEPKSASEALQGTEARSVEPPLAPAPVTAMTSAPISSRRQAPDIVNKPVVFPFDETPEKPEKGAPETGGETPRGGAPSSPDAASGDGVLAAVTTAETPSGAPGTQFTFKPESSSGEKTEESAAAGTETADDAKTHKKPHRAVVIVVDILLVIVVILALCFAIVKLAPGTGAAELILKAYYGIEQFVGLGDGESNAADENAAPISSSGSDPVMPISDGDTLVSSQLYNNYNIKAVQYDPSASWEEGAGYSIEGAAAAKPIADDYWSDGPQGPLLYDESAVAAVIRFDSGLVDYINKGDTNFLDSIAVGSPAEKKIAGYVASIAQLSVDSLGIGNIRKNGEDLYVWTVETATETMGGAPVQRVFKRLYLLTPDGDRYKVSDYEDIG